MIDAKKLAAKEYKKYFNIEATVEQILSSKSKTTQSTLRWLEMGIHLGFDLGFKVGGGIEQQRWKDYFLNNIK